MSAGRSKGEIGTDMTGNFKKFGYGQNDRSKIKPTGACRAEDEEIENSAHLMFTSFEGNTKM